MLKRLPDLELKKQQEEIAIYIKKQERGYLYLIKRHINKYDQHLIK